MRSVSEFARSRKAAAKPSSEEVSRYFACAMSSLNCSEDFPVPQFAAWGATPIRACGKSSIILGTAIDGNLQIASSCDFSTIESMDHRPSLSRVDLGAKKLLTSSFADLVITLQPDA